MDAAGKLGPNAGYGSEQIATGSTAPRILSSCIHLPVVTISAMAPAMDCPIAEALDQTPIPQSSKSPARGRSKDTTVSAARR